MRVVVDARESPKGEPVIRGDRMSIVAPRPMGVAPRPIAACLVAGVLMFASTSAVAAEHSVPRPPPADESQGQTAKSRSLLAGDAPGGFVKGEVIVTFGPNVSPERRIVVARRVAGGQISSSRLSPRAVVVMLPASTDVLAAAADLRRDPAVAWAEPNWYYQPTLVPNDPSLQLGEPTRRCGLLLRRHRVGLLLPRPGRSAGAPRSGGALPPDR